MKMKHETESRIMAEKLYEMAEPYIREGKEVRVILFNPILTVSQEIRWETECRLNGLLVEKEIEYYARLRKGKEGIEMTLRKKDGISEKMRRYIKAQAIKEEK